MFTHSPRLCSAVTPLLGIVVLLATGCVSPVNVSTLDSHGRPDLTPHYNYRPQDLAERLGQDELIDTLERARRIEGVFPSRASGLYLEAAAQAHALITDRDVSVYDQALIVGELYNRAVAGYVRAAPPNRPDNRVVLDTAAPAWSDVAYFESYTPAADRRIEGMREHVVQRGAGAALIAYRPNLNAQPIEDLYPPEGIFRPLTAVLHFEDSEAPRLALYDPRQTDTIELRPPGGGDPVELDLAADYTAPYAELLARADELAALGFAAMIDPEKAQDRLGVHLLEPYDPDKTPLLMVHGLMSTPLTWIELTNAVRNDPALRDKYQVWHFLYPTAPCPFYSAYLLRDRLEATRRQLDPELDDFATQDIVVVGHSMGGILTRTLVSDSTDKCWSVAFTVPPEELEGDPEAIELMKNVYIYQHLPYVNRAIFVATPHRGSNLATDLIGQFGDSLVRLPASCVEKTIAIARLNRDKLTPEYGPYMLNGPPSSIRTLDPSSPASRAVDTNPIRPGVTYHSIIGTRTDDFPEVEGTSDGIVDYWSSHLEGAASEKLVPAGHNAHDHPEAVVEIKRILREHLESDHPERFADRR